MLRISLWKWRVSEKGFIGRVSHRVLFEIFRLRETAILQKGSRRRSGERREALIPVHT